MGAGEGEFKARSEAKIGSHDSPLSSFQVDYSKFPTLVESEVTEKVTKGGGPGGQSVNKSNNAVRLKHVPTGATVKVHETRSLERNRKIAWQRLAEVGKSKLINIHTSVEFYTYTRVRAM